VSSGCKIRALGSRDGCFRGGYEARGVVACSRAGGLMVIYHIYVRLSSFLVEMAPNHACDADYTDVSTHGSRLGRSRGFLFLSQHCNVASARGRAAFADRRGPRAGSGGGLVSSPAMVRWCEIGSVAPEYHTPTGKQLSRDRPKGMSGRDMAVTNDVFCVGKKKKRDGATTWSARQIPPTTHACCRRTDMMFQFRAEQYHTSNARQHRSVCTTTTRRAGSYEPPTI
jgi:hypothetical protein